MVTNVVRPIASTPTPVASKPVKGAITFSSSPGWRRQTSTATITVVGANSSGSCLLRAPGPTAAHTDPFICHAHPSQCYASSPLVPSACREILFSLNSPGRKLPCPEVLPGSMVFSWGQGTAQPWNRGEAATVGWKQKL